MRGIQKKCLRPDCHRVVMNPDRFDYCQSLCHGLDAHIRKSENLIAALGDLPALENYRRDAAELNEMFNRVEEQYLEVKKLARNELNFSKLAWKHLVKGEMDE